MTKLILISNFSLIGWPDCWRDKALCFGISIILIDNLDGINPLGLRVQIFPNLPNIGEEFCNRWEIMLKQCSKLIIQTLIEEFRKRFEALKDEIRLFIGQGEKWNTHD